MKGDDQSVATQLTLLGGIAAELAHELRNVLQIISANAYLARQNTDAGTPFVAKIEKHARIAHALVDDMMALARGEALMTAPVAVMDLVESARAEFEGDGVRFVDAIGRELHPKVHAGLTIRLLHALYDNAIKAKTAPTVTIETRAWREGARVFVEVSDDGPGVPAEIKARILEPLVTGRRDGTGLGLALARRIAVAHGGALALVESPVGAKFRFDLPG